MYEDPDPIVHGQVGKRTVNTEQEFGLASPMSVGNNKAIINLAHRLSEITHYLHKTFLNSKLLKV